MPDPALALLIAEARAQPPEKDHVVVTMSNVGIHWLAESRSACDVIAMVLRPDKDCRVMPISEFITGLESLENKETPHDDYHERKCQPNPATRPQNPAVQHQPPS